MDPQLARPLASSANARSPGKFTLIYDDFPTGCRGKHFAFCLSAAMGSKAGPSLALWRKELLDFPELANHAGRDAADSEFVVFSFRGDHTLSSAFRLWLEAWLPSAADSALAMVALFDPIRGRYSHTESTRQYLRHVGAAHRIAFFCHHALSEEAEWGFQKAIPSDLANAELRKPALYAA